ncbi:MAG: Hsp20/alpha crystallin family protein [Miltoncostaeaceae bacterium]
MRGIARWEPTGNVRAFQGEMQRTLERSRGAFRRRFRLPADTPDSGIAAQMDGGVLGLTVPKAPEREPRRIEVAAGASDAD